MRGNVLVFTLATAIFLLCLQHSNACSCMPEHPQSQYCNSDFVILARIKRSKIINQNLIYKVRVRKEYKLSEKASTALKQGRLITPVDEAMCGQTLETGKLYVISGKVRNLRANINLCGMAILWKDLTKRQRKGLKAMYKHGCACKVTTCFKHSCPKLPNNCVNNFKNKCHVQQGICLKANSGKCKWTRNAALAKCLKDAEPRKHLPFLDGRDRMSGR